MSVYIIQAFDKKMPISNIKIPGIYLNNILTGKQLMLTLPRRHDFPALVVQSWERLSIGHDQVQGFIVILLHVKHPPVQA